jgi:hypothetical protein
MLAGGDGIATLFFFASMFLPRSSLAEHPRKDDEESYLPVQYYYTFFIQISYGLTYCSIWTLKANIGGPSQEAYLRDALAMFKSGGEHCRFPKTYIFPKKSPGRSTETSR